MDNNFYQNQFPFRMSAQNHQQNIPQEIEQQFGNQNRNQIPYNNNNFFNQEPFQQGMFPNSQQNPMQQMRNLPPNQSINGNGYQNFNPLQNRQGADQYQQFEDHQTQNTRFDNQVQSILPLQSQPQTAINYNPLPSPLPMNTNFFPQPYQNQNSQSDQLRNKVSELQNQNDNLQLKIDNLEGEKRRFQRSNQQIKELQNEVNEKEAEIDKLEGQLKQQSREFRDLKRNFQLQQQQSQWQAERISELEAERQQQQQYFSRFNQPGLNSNLAREMELQSQIDLLNRQKQSLEVQISRSQGEKETQYIQKISQLEDEIKELQQNRELFVKENQELKLSIKKIEQQKRIDNESINNLQRTLQEKEINLKNSQIKIQNQEFHIKSQEERFQNFYNEIKNNKGRGQDIQIQQLIGKFMQENQQRKEQYEMLQKQEEEKKRREIEIRNRLQEEKQIQQDKEKSIKVQQAKKIQQKMQESHGEMDVCFLVDVTQSMDKLKQQTQNCIKESIQEIKKLTGRDVFWAALCYKDRLESKNPAEYESIGFTKNSNEIEQWLEKVQCTGGGDQAEDIRGAIKDMCKLKWKRLFRLAILITDAPCHGSAYHEPTITDNHKREDIIDELGMLIQKEIILIGINFFKQTRLMYTKFEQIYKEHNNEHLLMVFDMENEPINQIAQKMVQKIAEGAQQATKTNRKETKSKNNEENQKNNKDGAIEALCKLNNFMNFETQPGIQLVNSSFEVFRIELSEDAFERNIKTIQFIQVPNDFQNYFEGKWDCIRTKNPFAYGQMKAVFLMKKKESTLNELYVVKTPKSEKPYRSLNEAIVECKSHLICQKLINKFYKDLGIAKEKKKANQFLQKMIYSDFLILKENENAFWIAERFLNGTFVKYNNNYGYINDDETDLNRMAQAFTYYTFFISDFNYMVNDIQGVNIYLTDPAINTKKGNFDETDMGEDGQSMYIANFKVKKYLCLELLQILGMVEENESKTLRNQVK